MNDTVGLRELRHDARGVIERVQATGRLLVTDRGEPLAVITPIRPERQRLDRVLALLADAEPTGWFEERAEEQRLAKSLPDRF